MKTCFACLLLMFFIQINASAQDPVPTSLTPSKFYTQSEPTPMQLTISGKNMWPDYMSITLTTQIMKVHFKKGGRDEVIRGIAIGANEQVVEFISTNWLSTPGDVEVYITIDPFGGAPAKRSNSLYLHVEATPTSAPVITSLSNSSFTTGQPREKYYIRIYGKNFGEQRSTSATIGGYNAPIGWSHLEDGVMDVWVPVEVFSKAGNYGVVVHTKYGESNPASFKIEQVLIKMAPVAPNNKVVMQRNPALNNVNAAAAISKTLVTADKAVKLKAEVVKGVRVTITGVVADGVTRASLENFITGLENVFVVDNQLVIQDSNGNINIVLKAAGLDKAAVDKIKKQIQDKASAMKLTVSI